MRRPTFLTWEQLKVGALIVVALLILGVAVVQLGAAANLFAGRYELVAFLPNANGLQQGGAVTVAGQLAGRIEEIEFLPVDGDTSRNLRVRLSVATDLQPQIREDSRAKIRTAGLLGDKTLDISVGTPRFSILQPGDTIETSPSLDYEQVIAQASGAVGDLVQLTADMRQITGGMVRGEGTMGQLLTNRSMYDQLTQMLTETDALLRRLQAPGGTFGRLLDDPTLYNRLTGTLASLDSAVLLLSSRDGTLGRLVGSDSLYRQLEGTVAAADSVLTLLHSGNGFASRMLTDQQLYDRLNKTVTDLAAILEDIRANPQKYTRGLIKVF
ncbi:MAG TPA: MlaD family protein [Gemmatimonadaceae bacterium]|nr:MlaD family protein [Gemmatimonadaceae bacterium]